MSDIENFFKSKVFKSMAPLVVDKELINEMHRIENIHDCQVKYPYKPFLLLSIVKSIESPKEFFTEKIVLSDYKIIKKFYDLVTSDYLLFTTLKNQTSKKLWNLGLNRTNISSVFSIMKQGPIKFLESKWFNYCKEDETLKFNFKVDFSKESMDYFEYLCIKAIKEAVPWFAKFNSQNISNLVDTEMMALYTNDEPEELIKNSSRKYQHLFRKQVLDRDKKCVVCCIENYDVLCACHIKPFKSSKNLEKYDLNNGVTMCANHHLLFDRGLFSFDNSWNLIVSKRLTEIDDSLFFKQYEDCYKTIFKDFAIDSAKDYLNYHRKIIFL